MFFKQLEDRVFNFLVLGEFILKIIDNQWNM